MDFTIKDGIYRFLFEHSNDAIFLSRPDGSVYRANPAACELFQRDEEDLCQVGRSGVVDLNDPRLELALRECAEVGRIRAELNFRRKDGSIFPADCVSSIFKDEQNRTWTVIIIRDMTAFKQAEEAMLKMQEEVTQYATYDSLTGILNRRAFLDKLQQEMCRSQRESFSLSLMIMDLDHFKLINDEMGHSCGDTVLKKIAHCLTERLRPYDILGRYGGDEFIACLPNTDSKEAHKIAERLRAHIEESVISYGDKHFSVTISIGLACYDNKTPEDIESLIIRADKNLYSAKEKRNTVC